MKLWLSRRRVGYLLTLFPPIWAEVRGTGFSDFYIKPGDPIGVNLCTPVVDREMGRSMQPGESIEVENILREWKREDSKAAVGRAGGT